MSTKTLNQNNRLKFWNKSIALYRGMDAWRFTI